MNKKYVPKVTNDLDAINLNRQLNDVRQGVEVGRWLLELLEKRFLGNQKFFRKWIEQHVDRDCQTIFRKMVLAQNAELLERANIVRLTDAYRLLNIDGNVSITLKKHVKF